MFDFWGGGCSLFCQISHSESEPVQVYFLFPLPFFSGHLHCMRENNWTAPIDCNFIYPNIVFYEWTKESIFTRVTTPSDWPSHRMSFFQEAFWLPSASFAKSAGVIQRVSVRMLRPHVPGDETKCLQVNLPPTLNELDGSIRSGYLMQIVVCIICLRLLRTSRWTPTCPGWWPGCCWASPPDPLRCLRLIHNRGSNLTDVKYCVIYFLSC